MEIYALMQQLLTKMYGTGKKPLRGFLARRPGDVFNSGSSVPHTKVQNKRFSTLAPVADDALYELRQYERQGISTQSVQSERGAIVKARLFSTI